MRGRTVLSGVATLVMLLASTLGAGAAHPGAAGPVRGGTVEVAFSDDFVSLDAAQAYSDDWVTLNGTLYNGLYQFDRNGQPQLDLAAAPPTVSADHKTWTFKLRQAQIHILKAAEIPLVYLKNVEMVSPNAGGFYYHPYFNWQFENYWTKR